MHIPISFAAAASAAVLACTVSAQCFQFANTPPGTQFAIANDDVRTFGLPFQFPFHGVNYDRITVCSNGFIWFGTGPTTEANDPNDFPGKMLSGPARVAVCWDDWDTGAVTVIPPGGGVFFSADSTQCSVVWKGIPRRFSTTIFANMECVLTASGGIHLYYDATMGAPNTTCITGISRGPGAVASLVNWSPTLPAGVADSTAYESFTINTGLQPFDLAGTTLNLVPNSPPNGVPPIAYTPNNVANPACVPYSFLPVIASTPTSSGTGCPSAVPSYSLYELFTSGNTNPFDLSNTAIRFTRAGDSYTTSTGSFDANYALTGTFQTGVRDDSFHVHTLGSTFSFGNTPVTTVTISANGYLFLGTSFGGNPDASLASFHMMPLPIIAGFWKDLLPTSIVVENTATKFQATWETASWRVGLFQHSGRLTFQISLDHATGDITLAYLTLTGNPPSGVPPLVGIAGIISADLGSSDLATSGVVNAVGPRSVTSIFPLAHSSTPAQIGLPLNLTFSNAPTSNLGFGVVILGDQTFSVTLDSIFGAGQAPGCSVYTNILSDFPLVFRAGATSGTLTLPVPYDIYMTSVTLNSQVTILAPVNPLLLVTSNAQQWTVGL